VIIARALAAAATAAAAAAWIVFFRAGIVLSHYDAKAHLVVARRIIDNVTPGWQQLGAVWLPLPHLINVFPAQIDLFYRTGAFASWVSIVCAGVTAYAVSRLVLRITHSILGAAVAVVLFVVNPNVLYIYATPLAEPLLLASVFLSVLWLVEWVPLNEDAVPTRLGWALFATAWTRYESWPVITAALVMALYASRRIGATWGGLLVRAWRLGVWPAAAVLLFLVISRITTGVWFVTGGFYVPDPSYQDKVMKSLIAVWWGTHELSTRSTEIVALGAALVLAGRAFLSRANAVLLVPVAIFAAGALPFYAFYEGHPFRIRYMIPLVVACALFCGLAVGILRKYPAIILAGLLVGITLIQSPPWRRDAPMLVEAQRDAPATLARRRVTVCLSPAYHGEKILASMGSLAHYIQELSAVGLNISDFVHEGTGVIWQLALETGPQPHVGWMLVEEQAEGGDALAQRIRRDPMFTRGMTRICDGGGVALYQRLPTVN
jgi:hypothetical protein